MTTARSIIEQASREIHVLGRGSTLPDSEAQSSLTALNSLMGSWSVEGGLVYTESKDTFSLTGATSYSIGTGLDFSTTRPIDIVSAFLTNGSTDYPLEIIDQTKYAQIGQKSTGGITDYLYYDNNSPTGNIYLYPVPDSSYTLTLYSVKPLTEFTSLTDDITLPSGYERALVKNLAVDLAPSYEKEASLTLVKTAKDAKDNLFQYNNRNANTVSTIDSVPTGYDNFDIYRGY